VSFEIGVVMLKKLFWIFLTKKVTDCSFKIRLNFDELLLSEFGPKYQIEFAALNINNKRHVKCFLLILRS